MRKSRQAKAETRDRIVGEAAQMFLERGVEAPGVADIMQAAGLTHGGFYKHFNSKDELLREAVEAAFAAVTARFDADRAEGGSGEAVSAYRRVYLSTEHIDHPGFGCPVAGIGAEAARQGPPVRQAFATGADQLISRMSEAYAAGGYTAQDARSEAIRELTQLVGTIIVARAVGEGPLRDEIMAAIRTCEPARSDA